MIDYVENSMTQQLEVWTLLAIILNRQCATWGTYGLDANSGPDDDRVQAACHVQADRHVLACGHGRDESQQPGQNAAVSRSFSMGFSPIAELFFCYISFVH